MSRPEFYILEEGFCRGLLQGAAFIRSFEPSVSYLKIAVLFLHCPPNDVTSIARDSFRNGPLVACTTSTGVLPLLVLTTQLYESCFPTTQSTNYLAMLCSDSRRGGSTSRWFHSEGGSQKGYYTLSPSRSFFNSNLKFSRSFSCRRFDYSVVVFLREWQCSTEIQLKYQRLISLDRD